MLELLGKFHAMLIHFPIVCFILAAVFEGWKFFNSGGLDKSIYSGSKALTAIGTFFAVLAASVGWIASSNFALTTELSYHRVLGTIAAITSLVVCYVVFKVDNYMTKLISLITLASLVGVAAHFGGTFVHGPLF